MNKFPRRLLSLILVLAFVMPTTAIVPAAVVHGATEASLTGDGVYVEVDEFMSMTVFRVEEDGTKTQMTQPITALGEDGATAVNTAPWKNALPWSAGTGTSATSFNNGSAKLLSAKSGYVTTGTRSTGSTVGNEVAVDDFATTDSKLESNVKTYFGIGSRLTVTGVSAASNLTRILVIETTDRVPGVISVTTKYQNNGASALDIARFVENNYKIHDPLLAGDYIANKREAGLWTQQGATLVWGADYVIPMFSTMGINTTTAMDANIVSGGESNNPTLVSRNNWFWGENGGLPFNDYWGTNVGILVGSAMPYCVRSMEIPTRGSGITGQHDTAYTWVGFPGQSLQPGVETQIGTTIVGVHTGDNYNGSKQYTQAMSYISDLEIFGQSLPSDWLAPPDPDGYPDYAWEGSWESWGGVESFDPKVSIDYVLNGTFKRLGIKYIVLDAAWYPRSSGNNSHLPGGASYSTASVATSQRAGEGNYIAVAGKWKNVADYFNMPFPTIAEGGATDAQVLAVVRKWNDFMHENGFKTAAWCMPMSFFQGSTLNAGGNQPGGFADTFPDYPITTNAAQFNPATGQLLPDSPSPVYKRQVGFYPQSGTAELCLGNPKVLNNYTDYFANKIFKEYGFDGLKIDTQWGTSQCFAIGHGHDDNPKAGYEAYALFWKLIYDKGKEILGEDPWIKHCQCGTMMNFFTQNGTNRPITGDPGGSNVRKARYSIKMWKGLYGDNAPAVSDHVENFGSRCKSLMAAGYVMESKFWNANANDPSAAIMKYFPIAYELSLPSGYFMDEYKFGFDYPEALAYDKPNQNAKYYSVFASNAPVASFSGGSRYAGGGETTMTYSGEFELRGLNPSSSYTLTVIDDNNSGNNVPLAGFETIVADAAGKAVVTLPSFTEVMIIKAELEMAEINDGNIRVIVDDNLSMQIFRNDGTSRAPKWTAMTQPITAMDDDGATAVPSAPWKNELPWSTGQGTATTTFHNNSAKLLSTVSGYVTAGARNTSVLGSQETLLADDFEVTSSSFEKGVNTYAGMGDRLTVTGYNAINNLERTVVIETSATAPGAVTISSYYKYDGEAAALPVAKFVENNFKIADVKPTQIPDKVEAGLWAYVGSDIVRNNDNLKPVYDTFGIGAAPNNYTALDTISYNLWGWGPSNDGIPINAIHGTNIGFMTGSAMPSHTYSMELPLRGSGITGNHETVYTWIGWPGKTLAKDVNTYVGTSVLGVHNGDFYDSANLFTKVMSNLTEEAYDLANMSHLYQPGLLTPAGVLTDGLPDWAYSPSYETWGYDEFFRPEEILAKLDELLELGISSVTLDASWYNRQAAGSQGEYLPAIGDTRYVDWEETGKILEDLYPGKSFPCRTVPEAMEIIKQYIKHFQDNGMKVIAWCQTPVLSATSMTANHPDWFIYNNTGGRVARLCYGNPDAVEGFAEHFVNRIFVEYGFDGIKGDSFHGVAQCFAGEPGIAGHGHDGNLNAAIEGEATFYKLLYEKASVAMGAKAVEGGAVIDKEKLPLIKNCQCGGQNDYFTYPGTNRAIAGDLLGSRYMRYENKWQRGFYGPTAMIDSDHDFLTMLVTGNEARRTSGPPDLLSILGVGSTFSTKYATAKYYPVKGTVSSTDNMGAMGYLMAYPGDEWYDRTDNGTASATYGQGVAANDNSQTAPRARSAYKYGDYVKYYGLNSDFGINRSEFMSLYKYGIDYPEAYAFKRDDNNFYYSFYATTNSVAMLKSRVNQPTVDPWGNDYVSANTYSGPVEIRGLRQNAAYVLTDIMTGKKLSRTSDASGLIKLSDVSFTTGIIYHVSPVAKPSISGKITNPDGGNVTGAVITLYDRDGKQVGRPTSSDLTGFYTFPVVPDKNQEYTLNVSHPNYPIADAYVYTGGPSAELSLNPGYNISSTSVQGEGGLEIVRNIKLGDDIGFNPEFSIENPGTEAKSVSVILASFDIDGRMISAKEYVYNIPANGSIIAQPSLDTDKDATQYNFFIWEDGYLPLTSVTSLD